MSAGIVSASTGAMNPLLGKLTALLGGEYKKITGVRRQASFLKDELGAIKALLEKLELTEELDPLAKNWRDHVREMSYDMENCIDDLVRSLGNAHAKTGLVKKTARRLRWLGKRHRIADRIEELKALAVEPNDRRKRYNIDDCINSSPCAVAVDPRMSAIYKEAAGLVGIDDPTEELVSWLTDTEKNLKVVSVVEFGGLGKRTLAQQVYDKIEGQFSYKAFVSVSQRPDMTSLVSDLQLKLRMEETSGAHEVQDIIDRIQDHLIDQRYLIVVDDLWDLSAWNIINCAFAEDGNGSRVIVTTPLDHVAFWVCRNDRECIYRMKPLKEQDSRRLFFNRVFGSEDGCPPQFKEVSAEILKKCGRLPLAIITIASMLASHQSRSRNEWEGIRNSLGAKFAAKPTLEDMRSILNLSYMHLPLHLRTCFLYLGMYLEDHEIKRDDMVRQWVAEGFVNHLHGSDLEDAAKSCFNELINRGMIQPEQVFNGEVLSCRVHDMMHDLILRKCAEDNFISVAYNYEDMARLHGCEYNVRRLSLKSSTGGATSGTIATNLSQVRSFAQFGEPKYTPPLSLFKYLRVLVFELPRFTRTIVDLTAIGQLFQLRYLKVSASLSRVELPTEFQKLVHLETLEIFCWLVRSILSDVVLLPHLSCLTLPYGTGLPEGIKNIKSLHGLWCFGMEKSSLEDIKGLGELTNLRNLSLSSTYDCPIEAAGVDALVSSIGKLRNLRDVYIDCHAEDERDPLFSLPDPPLRIEALDLSRRRSKRVPGWIGALQYLCNLCLCVEHLSTDDVHVLGKLPSVVNLYLAMLHISEDMPAIISTGLFPVLERLELDAFVEFGSFDDVMACVLFEAGAMPKLRRLDLALYSDWSGAAPAGMEHLLALEHIHVRDVTVSYEDREIESAFMNASQVPPRRLFHLYGVALQIGLLCNLDHIPWLLYIFCSFCLYLVS